MVCLDYPLEILLYGKNIEYLVRQVRTTQLVKLIRINPYSPTLYIISDLFLG